MIGRDLSFSTVSSPPEIEPSESNWLANVGLTVVSTSARSTPGLRKLASPNHSMGPPGARPVSLAPTRSAVSSSGPRMVYDALWIVKTVGTAAPSTAAATWQS